ncbi:MAG: bifunctional oligoribonuclease/PAP phosphatase NrnA [Clostridiales bacterium]|nr:bifunctional oligoribonuclease/PAP phosphatase NrnA [Clostridiales bacterium]
MNGTDRIGELIADAKTVGIAGHIRPDGDCTGSTLALYNYIKDGWPDVDARLYLEPIPNIFKFMERSDEIRTAGEEMTFDVFFSLDCGDIGRLGDASKYFKAANRTVCVDHHISNEPFGDENFVFPEKSSTSEIIFTLMDVNRITKEIAECLYTGIVHDTGVFQYSCTSSTTMNIAGVLMDKGIDYPTIVDETFYTKTFAQNRILGQALVDSRLYLDGKCIVSTVSYKLMKDFGVLPKHLEGIVNQLRVTKDVLVAVFIYEAKPQEYKVSLRANGDFDVASVAVRFGGGGHVKASGCSMNGCLEECVDKILAEIEKGM